jgi:hypothetical protein
MEQPVRPSSARRFLLLLVVLAGGLLALSIVQRDRALQQQYEEAQDRAELYAVTVFRGLDVGDVAGPLDGQTETDLQAEIESYVFRDPGVARLRLWGADGTLLFSTDEADAVGGTSDDPAIAVASDGRISSRLAVERVSPRPPDEGAATSTPLFQTFAPLRVRGSTDVTGAVQVDHDAAALEDRADDPWWLVQVAASGATAFLALLALIAVAVGMRRPKPPRRQDTDSSRRARRRGDAGWDEQEVADLRERLARATSRANEAEEQAKSLSADLQQVTGRLESVERQSSDARIDELKEALRRSEAERAMLRAGRPETQLEAEMRELRSQLRDAQALAKAAEATAGGDGLIAVQEQLSAAAREVDEATQRAQIAEGRADAAEDRARGADQMATAAEQRIDLLEVKLQEIAAAGIPAGDLADVAELRQQLGEAREAAEAMAARAAEAEQRLASAVPVDESAGELLTALEERLVLAEARAAEAEARVRSFEQEVVAGGSAFRQRLGTSAAGRKFAAPTTEPEPEPEIDLRAAIARGLRGPLTRATGLTLTLQGAVESTEDRAALRELSSSLRRLDQLAADLYDAHRILDGSLPLNRRRTDLAGLLATTLEEAIGLEDRLVRLDADSVHARVDPARARQIVEGMLDAAANRTRAGAAIVVRLRDTDAGARVSVEDDNRSPATIGPDLSLAARLAELHGTEITADGSTLRVVFPTDER